MSSLRLSVLRRALYACGAAVTLAVSAVLFTAVPASAHPLGNFTVNTYSGFTAEQGVLRLTFVLDMAEIPTFQLRSSQIDTNHDGKVDDGERSAFEGAQCASLQKGIELNGDGRPLPLQVDRSRLSFPPGAAGLTTLRLVCDMSAKVDADAFKVDYRSKNFTDRVGWREITATGDRMTVFDSSVPSETVSAELTRYPNNLLQSPLDEQAASFSVRAGGPALNRPSQPERQLKSPLPRGVDRATRAFSSFVGRQDLTLGIAALGVLLSLVLGAIHALAPGHGKTVMAAYLVGQKGTFRQALFVALTVTATHTAGVLALGLAISASTIVAPERLYPYLGLVSGLLLAAIGASIFLNTRRGGRRTLLASLAIAEGAGVSNSQPADRHGHHDHGHDEHGHDERGHDGRGHGGRGRDEHLHEIDGLAGTSIGAQTTVVGADPRRILAAKGDPGATLLTLDAPRAAPHVHSHGGRSHSHGPASGDLSLSLGSLLAMGFVGGFLPSPSAVVVLLGAIALGRVWFGVGLVIAYGLGMAATLAGAGLVLLRTRGAIDKRFAATGHAERLLALNRLVPYATATVIVVVGAYLSWQAALKI